MGRGGSRRGAGTEALRFVAGDATGENWDVERTNGPWVRVRRGRAAWARRAGAGGEGREGAPGQAGKGGRASPWAGPGRR